jgi:hypothetical protein
VLFSVSAKPGHEHANKTIMEKHAGRIRHLSTLSIVPLCIVRRKAGSSLIFEHALPYARRRLSTCPECYPFLINDLDERRRA